MSEDKTTLLEKKIELEARLDKIRQDIAGGLNPDSEERATQLENRDVLYEIQRVTAEELEAVKKRLNQIG